MHVATTETILVVEDDFASRRALTEILHEAGYRVQTACDGTEALETVRTAPPDLILSDVVMPRLSGLRMVAALRDACEEIPVILMSARNAPPQRTEGIDLGADDYLVKPLYVPELLARIRGQLHRVHAVRQLERTSVTDDLTGVLNRRGITDTLERERALSARTGAPLSILLLDINDFKRINDEHGHAAGDLVLQRLAELLVFELRTHDRIGRIGGDEFLVVAPATDTDAADQLLNRLRARCRMNIPVSTTSAVDIVVSIGAATAAKGEPRTALMQRADKDMYKDKQDVDRHHERPSSHCG